MLGHPVPDPHQDSLRCNLEKFDLEAYFFSPDFFSVVGRVLTFFVFVFCFTFSRHRKKCFSSAPKNRVRTLTW